MKKLQFIINIFKIIKHIDLKQIKIILSMLLIISTIYLAIRNQKLKEQKEKAEAEISIKTTEIIQYKDEIGRTITKTLEYSKTIEQLKFSKDSIEKRIYTELKRSDIKNKQITSLMYGYLESKNTIKGIYKDSLLLLKNKKDTIFLERKLSKIIKFDYPFINATVILDSVPKMTYSKKEEIYGVTTSERPVSKFFIFRFLGIKLGKKQSYIQVKSTDPNTNITIRKIDIQ